MRKNITKDDIKKMLPALVVLFILIALGTYAFDKVDLLGKQNLGIVANEEVALRLVEGEQDFKVGNTPLSDSAGKAQTTYYEFNIEGVSNVVYNLDYYLYLIPKNVGNTVDASFVKLYLTKVVNNSETVVVDVTTLDKLKDFGFNKLVTNSTFNFTSNSKTTKTDTYRLRVWLAEGATDNEETTPDVKETDDGLNIKAISGGYSFGMGVSSYKIGNEPNKPELTSNMIPVYYDSTSSSWKKADSSNTNETYKWYDYDNKMWANAVTVTETNRSTYLNANAGTEINMDDINTMWVWIPRYTYTYLNTNTPEEIKIKFENGTESHGTIKCTDAVTGGSTTTSQTCTDTTKGSLKAGTSTYTHPAFTFGDKELTGLWVGKFESSATTIPTSDSTAESTVIIKPNVESLRLKAISYQFRDARQMEKANNVYGFPQSSSTTFNWNGNLTGDTNNIDIHMMKNTEWGAVTYLYHSKYGRCTDGTCEEITITNCNTYTTGIGADEVSERESSATCTTDKNKYNGESGVKASTTGNVYGVYDMSGGSFENTMSNMVNSSNQFYTGSASNWSTTTYPLAKYYDSYTYGGNTTTYARGRLGDATVEMSLSSDSRTTWYSDYADFPGSSYSWFKRGGFYNDGTIAGAFGFAYDNGSAGGSGIGGSYQNNSFRVCLGVQAS